MQATWVNLIWLKTQIYLIKWACTGFHSSTKFKQHTFFYKIKQNSCNFLNHFLRKVSSGFTPVLFCMLLLASFKVCKIFEAQFLGHFRPRNWSKIAVIGHFIYLCFFSDNLASFVMPTRYWLWEMNDEEDLKRRHEIYSWVTGCPPLRLDCWCNRNLDNV